MKIVNYPIPGDDQGGELHLYGDASAKTIVIAIPGYPDDQSVLAPMAEHLASTSSAGGIFVGVTCFPGFQVTKTKNWKNHPTSGYMLEQVVSCIGEAVKKLRQESTNKSSKLSAIFFDWGAVLGQVWVNRVLHESDSSLQPNDVVLLDVLGPPHPSTKDNIPKAEKKTLYEKVVEVLYRLVLAAAFFLHSRGLATLAKCFWIVCFMILGISQLGPLRDIDTKYFKKKGQNKPIDLYQFIYMAYPYYYLFKDAVFNQSKTFASATLPADLNKTPVLYIYGKEKNAKFHSNTSLALLHQQEKEKKNKSKAIGIDGAGHFFFTENQQKAACFEAIEKFIVTTK
eukprot:CAMPEP_0198138668 /NCGR_PEP_ID=MMETSP1443-20131203/2066_1 /TAXON_ID=186043 /ORGANISM="Entomoneis sp., Strain CCMP2396" /LENGTH=339 /DNA_ID=CAMNT_0043800549 /DNA_START=106 /DNA_END=1125 /DNA_ORIENTATION=-